VNTTTAAQPANRFSAAMRQFTLIFLIAMAAIHIVSLFVIAHRLPAGYQDFTIFYTAGKMLARGEGGRLYDNSLQYQTQLEFAPYASIRKGPLPYNHIPVEALLFVPFAKLPFSASYAAWDLLNLVILAATLLILRPHLTSLRDQPLILGLVLALAFFPVYINLVQGQDALLLTLLLSLAYSALRKNANFAAGCWMGLGLFRFTLVLPLAFIIARRGGTKLIAGFSLAGLSLLLGSAMVTGWKSTLLYPAYVLRVERNWVGPTTATDMPNLRGLLETLSGRAAPSVFTAIALVLSLFLVFFCWNRWKQKFNGFQFDLTFSLSLIAVTLASYHAYLHDLSILLIAVLLLIDFSRRQSLRHPAWQMWLPVSLLFITPLCAVVLFKMQMACLFAIPLLTWFWAMARESPAEPNPGSTSAMIDRRSPQV
jgi:hypothetical protein